MKKIRHFLINYYWVIGSIIDSWIHRTFPYKLTQGSNAINVVFISGLFHKWNSFRFIIKGLQTKGFWLHGINALGRNTREVPKLAAIVNDYITHHDLRNVILIGHSKGGIVGKYLLTHFNQDHRIIKLIAISTPFNGTTKGDSSPLGMHKEMGTKSSIIIELQKQPKVNSSIVSLYGTSDDLISPLESCRLEGAINIQLDIQGHQKILFDSRTSEAIIQNIYA